jgi:hypothetical protein
MSDTHTTLTGLVELQVQTIDGSAKTVQVRQIPIRHIQKFLGAQDDEIEQVKLFTALTDEEIDHLPVAEFERILEEGQRANFPSLNRFLERKIATAERMAPLVPRLQALQKP